jgi:pyruvyltransferase
MGNFSLKMKTPILAKWYEDKPNFGDLINPYLIERYTGVKPVNLMHVYRGLNLFKNDIRKKSTWWALSQRLGLTCHPEYLCVGSILGWGDWKNDIQVVWGAGFMTKERRLKFRPCKLISVRGEKTLAGIPTSWRPEIKALGDPGVLCADFLNIRNTEKTTPIGLVPHFTQKNTPAIKNKDLPDKIRIIDIQQDVEPFLRDLCRCNIVISSALHGIIAADALGLPNRWITFGTLPAGGLFKFHDYFSVAGGFQDKPDLVESPKDMLSATDRALKRDISGMQQALRSCNPFKSP